MVCPYIAIPSGKAIFLLGFEAIRNFRSFQVSPGVPRSLPEMVIFQFLQKIKTSFEVGYLRI